MTNQLPLPTIPEGEEEKVLPTPRLSRRGEKHMSLADTFLFVYPIGSILTISEFDNWAFDVGEYVNVDANVATELDVARYKLRTQINNGGTSALRAPAERFVIAVHTHRVDYLVKTAKEELSDSIDQFPHQIEKNFKNKRARIQHLVDSPNYDDLPFEEQMRIEMLTHCMDRAKRMVEVAMADFESEWEKGEKALIRAQKRRLKQLEKKEE